MKTKLLLLAILLASLSAKTLYADDSVFPKSDAIWVIHVYGGERPLQVVYGLKGDTLINEIEYQKLYLLNDTTLNINKDDIFVAGIRQADKKVWVQPADKTDRSSFEEFLMYDFSKIEGETIEFGKRPIMGFYNMHFTFEDIAPTSISSLSGVAIYPFGDGDISIAYNEVSIGADTWKTGVGGLGGLFFHPLQFPSGIGSPVGCQLICMKYRDEIKYLGNDCTSCFDQSFNHSSSLEEENMEKLISIRHNSRSKSLEIDFNSFIPKAQFSLYTIDGNMINSFPLIEAHTDLNTTSYYSGLYLYKIVGQDLYQTGKLIIE